MTGQGVVLGMLLAALIAGVVMFLTGWLLRAWVADERGR